LSARDIYGHTKAIHISSLTLKKRFNPAATVPADKLLPNELKADPRQVTEFAAAFTLGSIKCLSNANANSVTLFQTEGNQGIISLSGQKYPMYNVLQEILSNEPSEIIYTESSEPLTCDGVLLVNAKQKRLMLVNYTEDKQRVTFQNKEYPLEPYATQIVNINGSVFV
jgi:D-apionolactonase